MEGKGPIVFEETEFFANNPIAAGGFLFKWDRPVAKKFWEKLFEKEGRYTSDHAWRPEIIPPVHRRVRSGQDGSLNENDRGGHVGAGRQIRSGSGWAGAVPPLKDQRLRPHLGGSLIAAWRVRPSRNSRRAPRSL